MHLKVKIRTEIILKKYIILESDICQRLYCPRTRRFDLHIVDSTNQVYIYKRLI
jgi:hypothetical protein